MAENFDELADEDLSAEIADRIVRDEPPQATRVMWERNPPQDHMDREPMQTRDRLATNAVRIVRPAEDQEG
jgi:hypothetical protein